MTAKQIQEINLSEKQMQFFEKARMIVVDA